MRIPITKKLYGFSTFYKGRNILIQRIFTHRKGVIIKMSTLKNSLMANSSFGDLFESNMMIDSYKTGIAPLDYYLGYMLNIYDDDDNVVDSYPCLGFNGGCSILDIGKSSTAKTSTMLFIAAMIVRNYDNGLIIHYDLEQAMNLTRAKTMTKFTIKELKDKYILRQMNTSIEDIKIMILELYKEKTSNPKEYMYDSGKKDEYGNEIIMFQPTVVMIDSIPSLSTKLSETNSKEWAKLEELTSQTDRMRLTGEVGRFYTDILPYLRAANIIVISINHIKDKAQLGIVKNPAELLYLKQDEALPGGKAPVYLAHYLLKNVAIGSGKFNMEDDGFDGFLIRIEIIKSRSNQAGQYVEIVYDKVKGVSPVRTCIHFAKENGLIGGNKNAMYFVNNKENKFPLRTVEQFFSEHKEMYTIMYDHIRPILESKLSQVRPEELTVDNEIMDY